MNLHFCDLCNESIPQADLDLRRAVRRNERLICAACEAAMSGGATRPAPPPAAIPAPGAVHDPRPSTEPGASPVAAVALAFASVALVAGAGAGVYFFWRLEVQAGTLRQQVADLQRAAPEHARTVSAALAEESGAREQEAAEIRAALQALAARMQEAEHAGAESAALERRLDKLDARFDVVDDLSSRVQHQAGTLERLAASVAELAARPTVQSPPERADAPGESVPEAAPGASANAPGGALWEKWVADLASSDSGTRWQAVQSLGGTRDPLVVPHLVPMLEDSDIFVRMAACRHLGDLGSVEAIPALIDTLEDEEASVREAALVSLRGLSGQSIPFDPLARDGDRSKRVKAWRDWWEEASKELLGRGRAKSKG
jgi:Skp family chaperone for outer membrane proteins